MLKDNRFILRAMGADADAGGAVSLHALTIGYVAKLPGPGGRKGLNLSPLHKASPRGNNWYDVRARRPRRQAAAS